jgi:hypothetical protein
MVKHVLFVKLQDPSQENCEEIKKLFLSMKEEIPFIRDIQVGIDFLHSDRSYDIVLELTLDNQQALEDYQNHPYHVNSVKSVIHQKRCGSATVDYEY